MGIHEHIPLLIERYGNLFVFFGVMLACTGIPIPSQLILIASGVLAQQGYLGLTDALVFGILGAVAGEQIGYWVGHKGGRPVIERWGHYILVTPERLARAEHLFREYGGKTVLFARFIPGLRVFSSLLAGISQMSRKPFLFYNVLGGVLWPAIMVVLIGYFLIGHLLLSYVMAAHIDL
ncbi:MAG: DedA family protein [Rubrobacter sp.]|nr:DedA family protein [Rubrobacter sp.]